MTHIARATKAPFTLPFALMLAMPANALDLAWPDGAVRVFGDARATSGYAIATAGYDGAEVPSTTLEGDLVEEVWQIPGDAGESVPLLRMLRMQLLDQGYEQGFACADRACGGFDFRYALPIAEGPEMHVDLGDFHYLTATRESEDGPDTVVVTVSHGGQQGYAHLVHVTPIGTLPAQGAVSSGAPAMYPAEPGRDALSDFVLQLLETGSGTLDDLRFETGASELSGSQFDSLVALAQFLSESGARQVILVGHTDAEGSLAANISLSEARANAVRRYLIDALGTDPAQVEAAGIGFLAPRASNASDAGREANRRVEVVLIGR